MKAQNCFPIPLRVAWISSEAAGWVSCWPPSPKNLTSDLVQKSLNKLHFSAYLPFHYCIMEVSVFESIVMIRVYTSTESMLTSWILMLD